jgi:hypothetical protein
MPSGTEPIALTGPAMVPLVGAIAALAESGLGTYAVVGGVGVAARLGRAHRATADVDTVVDETTPPDAVEALLSRADAKPDPSPSRGCRCCRDGYLSQRAEFPVKEVLVEPEERRCRNGVGARSANGSTTM